jgi:hypothetical protein
MEQPISVLAPASSGSAESYLVPTAPVSSLPATVSRIVPTAQQRAILKAQVSCMALSFAALILVAVYVLVPLAMAVHDAINIVVLAWGVAAAVLIELFLLIAFIILKTEGQERGNGPSNSLP